MILADLHITPELSQAVRSAIDVGGLLSGGCRSVCHRALVDMFCQYWQIALPSIHSVMSAW